jgi:hypothetical protein
MTLCDATCVIVHNCGAGLVAAHEAFCVHLKDEGAGTDVVSTGCPFITACVEIVGSAIKAATENVNWSNFGNVSVRRAGKCITLALLGAAMLKTCCIAKCVFAWYCICMGFVFPLSRTLQSRAHALLICACCQVVCVRTVPCLAFDELVIHLKEVA